MPPWIVTALRAIAVGIAGGAGAELAVAAIPGGIPAGALIGPIAGQAGIAVPGQGGSGGYVDHHGIFHTRPHRRRRRRALTASDRADIAFIAGLLGTSAGSKFAAIIGAK